MGGSELLRGGSRLVGRRGQISSCFLVRKTLSSKNDTVDRNLSHSSLQIQMRDGQPYSLFGSLPEKLIVTNSLVRCSSCGDGVLCCCTPTSSMFHGIYLLKEQKSALRRILACTQAVSAALLSPSS